MNFRIVLNNAEITSMKSLQQFFDFEKFLVNDQMQLIRWLKWVDKKKGSQRGNQIEAIVNDTSGNVINNVAIPLIMGIIYEQSFGDMVQFVNFLYGHDDEDYKIAKDNFSHFISNHGDKLHDLFPIENIPLGNNNLDNFFGNLYPSTETSSYLSQLNYRQGDIELSQMKYPPLWVLNEKERTTIKGISAGRQVIPPGNLSIIGTEFIFLCAITYLTLYHEDDTIKSLSKRIDQRPEYRSLRDRIGGSLEKLINEKDRDCYQICEQLGYTNPQDKDPLFNEKLFLSSFFADDYKRDKLLSTIKKKNDYYPALFVIDSDRYESGILQSQQEVQYTWFRYILDYHDNPMGLDGDDDRYDNGVNEKSIILSQYKEDPSFMNENFCTPYELEPDQGDLYLRERIQRIKQSFLLGIPDSDHLDLAPLKRKEQNCFDFFKEVIYLSQHWNEYIESTKGGFTLKAEKLIEKYRNKKSALYKERLFVVTILILVRDHNKNKMYLHDTRDTSSNDLYAEIVRFSKSYIPLKGLFKDQIRLLTRNDKKILNLLSYRPQRLETNFFCGFSSMGSLNYRKNYYNEILRRWIANFVYYI